MNQPEFRITRVTIGAEDWFECSCYLHDDTDLTTRIAVGCGRTENRSLAICMRNVAEWLLREDREF